MKCRPKEQNFLGNLFNLKLRPSVASAHAQITLFETRQTLQAIFLGFYNNFLVSHLRKVIKPSKFSKYVSLAKEID